MSNDNSIQFYSSTVSRILKKKKFWSESPLNFSLTGAHGAGQGVGAMSATESEVYLAGHGKDRKWFFNLDMDLPTSPIFLGHFLPSQA